MINYELLNYLESILHQSDVVSNGDHSFYCPFHSHHKKKMVINIDQSLPQYENWHCWVCGRGGNKLSNLVNQLKKLGKISNDKVSEFFRIYSPGEKNYSEEDVIIQLLANSNNIEYVSPIITLPVEFRSLLIPNKKSPDYRNAMHYLINRGLTKFDILKYNIGYCEDGKYSGRIIIPSYNNDGLPNYFQARLFYDTDSEEKYKNPAVDYNQIIPFEIFINWNKPIVFVEGMFDSIICRNNSIPTLGKNIFDRVIYNIYKYDVKDIYLFYDPDALSFSYELAERFINDGRNVYIIESPNEKDPAELGYAKCTELITKAIPVEMSDIIKMKFL